MKLDDAALREAVACILARHPGSGLPRIRQSLRDQFGFACGTDRLRRMLRAVRTLKNEKPAQADGPTGASTDLSEALSIAQQEVLQWKERAERAEAREIAHQSRWAQEIDSLRQQLQGRVGNASAISQQYALLRKQHDFALRQLAELRLELARRPQEAPQTSPEVENEVS
jgi:hypothetical protein